ncbi:MAG: BTAD domain-containing putative transcriptional regulator [Pseudomonadota bacterium]
MGTSVRLAMLGEFAVFKGGSRVALPTRKTRALAAYLALNAGRRLGRANLCNLLWSDQPERKARQSLRQALSAVRLALGAATLECDEDTVLCRSEAFDSDVREFEALARSLSLAGAERARALYRGELLSDCSICEPAFVEWLQAERERFRELARRVLGSILLNRCEDPELNEAVATANALLRLDPFDEAVHRTLMQLHARRGRTNAALQHFQDFTRMLRREIGVKPEDETIALYDRLCAERASIAGVDTLAEYAFVLEQMAQCVVVTDCSSRIIGWNRFAEERLGFTKDFMFGRKPTLMYAPARDQSISDDVLRSALQRGHWSSRVKLLSKDGHECYQTRTVQPLYDRQGVIIGAFGTGVPV